MFYLFAQSRMFLLDGPYSNESPLILVYLFRQAISCTNDDSVRWRIYVPQGVNEATNRKR